LSKLLVNDMAGEFGISVDEVISLLRQMDVPVRSHMTPLSDDQVARIRARWEREKRARATAPAAAPARRRRGAAAAEAPAPAPEPVAESAGRRRRRAADTPAPAAEPETIAVSDVSVPEAPQPTRRRAAAPSAPPAPEPVTSAPPVEEAQKTEQAAPAPTAAAPAAPPSEQQVRPAPARPDRAAQAHGRHRPGAGGAPFEGPWHRQRGRRLRHYLRRTHGRTGGHQHAEDLPRWLSTRAGHWRWTDVLGWRVGLARMPGYHAVT